jgi:hypothetical protein
MVLALFFKKRVAKDEKNQPRHAVKTHYGDRK